MMPRFTGCILDLDGTVYRGDELIAGADAAVARLRENGSRVVFLSNNPTRDPAGYAEKLTRLGIPSEPSDIITSAEVLRDMLLREQPHARLYVVGEDVLISTLRDAGFETAATPEETDIVVVGFDRTFHYGKLLFAHSAVRHGARIWATNPDKTCPVAEGDIPDCGALIAALETCTGAKVERIAGKPSPGVIHLVSCRMGVPVSDCLLVGDRLETDIAMARAAGCASALVLTGVTTREKIASSPVKPDRVLDSIRDLPDVMAEGEGR